MCPNITNGFGNTFAFGSLVSKVRLSTCLFQFEKTKIIFSLISVPADGEFRNASALEMGNPWPGECMSWRFPNFVLMNSRDLKLVHFRTLDDKMEMSSANYGELPQDGAVGLDGGTTLVNACGAAVIHPLVLVTTARCRFGSGKIAAVTGFYRRRYFDDTVQKRNVRTVIPHGMYNSRTLDNNIALIVLEEPLRFDDYTSPIEIPEGNRSRKRNSGIEFKVTFPLQSMIEVFCFRQMEQL